MKKKSKQSSPKPKGSKGYPPPEFLEEVYRLARELTRRCKFGYYDREDLYQELVIVGMDAWNRYDKSRPAGPFLRRHLSNQLRNIYRNKVHRSDTPCEACAEGRFHDCERASSRAGCPEYRDWQSRNGAKASIMSPAGPENSGAEWDNALLRPDSVESQVIGDELRSIIDEKLPVALRADFLKMLAYVRLPATRRDAVRAAILAIIGSETP